MINAIDALNFRKIKLGVMMKAVRYDETVPWCDRQAAILAMIDEMNELEFAITIIKNNWVKAYEPSLN